MPNSPEWRDTFCRRTACFEPWHLEQSWNNHWMWLFVLTCFDIDHTSWQMILEFWWTMALLQMGHQHPSTPWPCAHWCSLMQELFKAAVKQQSLLEKVEQQGNLAHSEACHDGCRPGRSWNWTGRNSRWDNLRSKQERSGKLRLKFEDRESICSFPGSTWFIMHYSWPSKSLFQTLVTGCRYKSVWLFSPFYSSMRT